MRRGERQAWRDLAEATKKIAESDDPAKEYMAKIAMRAAFARLYGIPGVSGLPRSGAMVNQ